MYRVLGLIISGVICMSMLGSIAGMLLLILVYGAVAALSGLLMYGFIRSLLVSETKLEQEDGEDLK